MGKSQEIDATQLLKLIQSTKQELQRLMVTQDQGKTMQADINQILLRVKELQDNSAIHDMMREEFRDSLKRQTDKIEVLLDDTEMHKQDILDLKKETKNKVGLFEFESGLETITHDIQALEDLISKASSGLSGAKSPMTSLPRLRKQRSVNVGEMSMSSGMIAKFKEMSEMVEIMMDRQKKLDQ